jgi:uncharacterized protein YodC (DUF2158 family)
MAYETGDKVKLISDGQEMTVIGVIGTGELTKNENFTLKNNGGTDGDVYCEWHSDTKLERGVFKTTMLKKL